MARKRRRGGEEVGERWRRGAEKVKEEEEMAVFTRESITNKDPPNA